MPIVRSRTDAVNLALIRIGTSRRISSMDEDSAIGRGAKLVFQPALELVTASHPWNFAITRDNLSADGDAPAFGYEYQYSLPGECLRWLPPDRDDSNYYEAVEEGGKILTNREAPLPVRFICLVEEAARWSPGFNHALAYRIGLDLAYAVTALAEVSKLTEDGFTLALREGKRIDARSGQPRDRGASDDGFTWLEARR